jgi:hypothetical protein
MDRDTKSILIFLSAVVLLVVLTIVSGVSAFTIAPGNTYYLQGQQISNYTSSEATLENGTIILLDNANVSLYLPQMISQLNTVQAPTFYSNDMNYALKLNQTGNYSPWTPNITVRIQQGDCVTLGETIDISGDGWNGGHLVYYGLDYYGYSDDYSDPYVTLLDVPYQNLTRLYLDPNYFYQYPGWWYYYYPYYLANTTGEYTAGNDRAFFVGDTCQKPNLTEAQSYVLNLTQLYQNKEANLTALPIKTVFGADYVVSRNETTTLPAPNGTHEWLFGRIYGKYDIPTQGNTTTISQTDGANWESGIYNLIFTFADADGLFDQHYSNGWIQSPFTTNTPVYVGDKQPQIIKNTLVGLITLSMQKNYSTYNVALGSPEIDVMKLDQWQGFDNETLVSMAGYTNANPGDVITVAMDQGQIGNWHQIAAHSWSTTAYGNMTEYRDWNISFVFNVQKEFPGQHNFTISDNAGASVNAPFYVMRELAPDFIPNKYLQFINNSPFIPPVYVTVTVPVPGPTRIITEQLTPSTDQINNAAQAIVDKQNAAMESDIILVVIIGILVGIVAWFVWSLKRARK